MKKLVILILFLFVHSYSHSYELEKSIDSVFIESKPYFSYLPGKTNNYSISTCFLSLPDNIYAYELNFYYSSSKDCFGLSISYLNITDDFFSSSGYYNNLYEAEISFNYSRVLANPNSLNNLILLANANLISSFLINSYIYKLSFDIGTLYIDSVPMLWKEKKYNLYLGILFKDLGFASGNSNSKILNSEIMALLVYGFLNCSDLYTKVLTLVEYNNLFKKVNLGIELDYSAYFKLAFEYDILNNRVFFNNLIVIPLGTYLLSLKNVLGISELGNIFSVYIRFDF